MVTVFRDRDGPIRTPGFTSGATGRNRTDGRGMTNAVAGLIVTSRILNLA